MTTAIIDMVYSDGVDYFSFFIGSDGDKDTIRNLWLKYCELVNIDTLENKSRMNWIYVATNFMRFVQENLYEHKKLENLNRVCIVFNDNNDVIHRYKIRPIENSYKDYTIPLEISVKLEILK